MKKLVALIAMLVVSLLCFTACNTTPAGKADSFERAKTYLQNLYSQGEENTPSDYEVVRQIRINGHSFPITWEVEILTEGIEPDAIKVEKGSTHYKIDVPDETTIVIKYLLKGTISNREETVTKSFPRVVPQSIPARKPVEGVEYNMAMVQFGIRKALYFNGQTESASVNYRLAMSESVADAVSVYIENHAEVEGAFYIYFIDANGTKTYIETYEREAGKGSLQLVTETPANYYVWNDALKLPIHVNADGSNSYYMGTYSTYKTISISNTSYILNSDGTPKNLDTTQFPARFFEPGTDLSGLLICEHKWQEATCTEPKTCPLCKETEGEALGHKGGTATCTEKAICEVCAEYYGELLEHNFVDGKCSVCGEPASDTPVVVLSTVELTVGSIGLAADSYAAGTATVGDVAFEYIELGNYGNGIQMRNKTVASSLWNTTAIDISKIELVYNAAQANYSNSNALKFEFSNNADFSDAHVVYLSTVKGQTTAYTVEADATYKYVRMTNNITYAMYWDSITIYYTSTGSDTPAVCEHEGGTATCKELAVCTKCGEAYGELAAHSFVAGVCSVCGAKDPNYVAPEVSTWTVVTELKDGDQVLIGAPAYGKLLSMVKTGYYNVGVDYTADNFDNVTDNEIFVVTVNADGTYSFTSLSGKVLALAASYSSLNDTGVNKSWSLVDKGNGVYYLKNTGRNTYLEWYASMNNWSTYGTASSDLFEISFYAKKGGETPAVCEHEGGNATCKELAVCSKCGEAYGKLAAHDMSEATCTVLATCSVCGLTEGEYADHNFADGACSVCGEKDPNAGTDVPVVGGGKSDFETIEPPVTSGNYTGGSSSYETRTSAAGWVATNAALLVGGTSDANPVFKFIGADNTVKAITLNGKTTAAGVLTSPVLSGGIATLTFNYGHAFSDKNGINITITFTEVATGTKYSVEFVKAGSDVVQKTAYTETITLETAISGDFTIVFTNNSPSNNTGNKDRVSLWNIEWTAPEAGCAHTGGTATCKELAVCELCGEAYGELAAHAFADATCQAPKTCSVCGETEGELGDHAFADATCTAPKTCSVCGETEGEKLGHVDADLDIECDREGCTSKVAPANDSLLSNRTANLLGSKLSTSNTYYVEGTIVEVLDPKNGIFLIDDGTGETFYFRLPKNAEGVSHANWEIKLTLGDKVKVYGKINKYTTTEAPNGQYYPAMQSPVVTLLEQHEHAFTQEATCYDPAFCVCGQGGGEPNAHVDGNADNACDNCGFAMGTTREVLKTQYNDIKETENVDTTNGTMFWLGTEFKVLVDKGTSSLNTNATDHFRVQNYNNLTISTLNGKKLVGVTLVATTSSYVDELEAFITSTGYAYTVSGLELTIALDSVETVTFANTASKVARIKYVKAYYVEAAPAVCEHEGGTATCKELAVCSKCGEAYGELADHVWDTRGYSHDAAGHWLDCALCQISGEKADHVPEYCNDGDSHSAECTVCFRMVVDGEDHTYVDGSCVCGAQEPAAIEVLTVAEFIALSTGMAHNTYTTDKFYVAGVITSITNTSYGNMIIKDVTGEVLIYGTYSADGSTSYGSMSNKPVVGDTVVIYTVVGVYSNAPQGKNGWIVEQTAGHDCVFSTEWTADATHHWNACVYCEAVKEGSKVEHNFEGGECACGTSDPSAVSEVVFELGANGSASHNDGSDASTSSTKWTVDGYTLSFSALTKVYSGARDAKGNSCLKLGTSKLTGSLTFTVPENVNKVVINVAGYKAATSTNIKINGTQYTVKTASNNGEYTAIEIDTSSTKTINLVTVTYRCMINSIVYVIG